MKNHRFGAVFILFLFILSGCGLFQKKDPLSGSKWKLTDIQTKAALADPAVTIEFKEGKVQGSGGCNGYFGGYELKENQLTFQQIGSTMMACTPQEIMDQEQKYFKVLANTAAYQLEGGKLSLLDKAGAVILLFESQQ